MMGYQCFHCGQNTVFWNGDFDFSDYGYEGEGIIHNCTCSNCGAEIEYRVKNHVQIRNEDDTDGRTE